MLARQTNKKIGEKKRATRDFTLKENIRTSSDEERHIIHEVRSAIIIYIYTLNVFRSHDHGSYEAEVIGREGEGWFGDVNNSYRSLFNGS